MIPKKEHILSHDPRVQKEALEAIYDYCFPKIVSYIGNRKEGHLEAGDILQDAVAVVYQNIRSDTFEGKSSINTYTLSICKKLWLYRHRSESRVQISDINDEMMVGEEKEAIVRLDLLKKVTDRLSTDCQDLLKSFYFRKSSMDEIAKKHKLGSVQAAKNKKWRCLKVLMTIVKSFKLDRDDFYL